MSGKIEKKVIAIKSARIRRGKRMIRIFAGTRGFPPTGLAHDEK
jgi:hypothetical protein